jgi:fibronectin type 3 domain-containing protein
MDGEQHLSEAAASEVYTPRDTFVPTVPTGLTGAQGASTVELSWDRNTDERFQGYNVYRSVGGAPPEKIASLITAPVYTDTKVETGKTYRYTVSGVGMNGIESPQSAPYEITMQ